MATKKVGVYIKEARTAAKLTQEKLGQAAGVTAAEIGKCERGEIDLTSAQLKKIAVACGVTQSSLLNAPKNLSASAAKKAAAAKKTAATAKKTTTAKKAATAKTTTAKTSSAKKTTAKTTNAKTTDAKKTTTAAKKPAASADKKKPDTKKKTTAKTPAVPASANVSMKVTSTEKKLVEAYRGASSDLKKISLKLLKGEYDETVTNILGVVGGSGSANAADQIGDALGNLLGGLIGGK